MGWDPWCDEAAQVVTGHHTRDTPYQRFLKAAHLGTSPWRAGSREHLARLSYYTLV